MVEQHGDLVVEAEVDLAVVPQEQVGSGDDGLSLCAHI